MDIKNIFLIGYRCSGKTTVGKALALRLNFNFVDTDAMLVQKYGLIIAKIIAEKGWQKFRKMEEAVIKKVCNQKHQVVAFGGGAVLSHQNITAIQNNGKSVWLQVTPEIVRQRMLQDKSTPDMRPALTSLNLMDEITQTLKQREPLYRRAMDFAVSNEHLSISQICDIIIKHYNFPEREKI